MDYYDNESENLYIISFGCTQSWITFLLSNYQVYQNYIYQKFYQAFFYLYILYLIDQFHEIWYGFYDSLI